MTDQAAGIRALRAHAAPPVMDGGGRAIVVGSGKGGAGKSVVSVWLAAALARSGRRVLLFDAALAQGNLHLLLGVAPARTLERYLSGACALEDLVERVGERLWLLPAPALDSIQNLGPMESARLHDRLTPIYDQFDTVVVDTAPGLECVVRAATLRAGALVVVTLPEPAALADAYAVIKRVHHQVPTLRMDVLVNRTETKEEGASSFECLRSAAARFLGRELGALGLLPEQRDLRARMRTPGGLLREIPAELAAAAETLVPEGAPH